jgi:hypothetical protein
MAALRRFGKLFEDPEAFSPMHERSSGRKELLWAQRKRSNNGVIYPRKTR